jgi:hypothetical protein
MDQSGSWTGIRVIIGIQHPRVTYDSFQDLSGALVKHQMDPWEVNNVH